MKRSPELEAMTAADETAVSSRNAGRNQTIGMTALLLGGAVAAYFVLATAEEKPRDVVDGDEEFQTTTFRPPSFVREQEEPKSEKEPAVINLPPPPEPVQETPVDTTEFKVPPPPEAVEYTPEAAPVEEFPERYRSDLISLDQKGNGNGNGGFPGEDDSRLSVAGEDRNSKYLAAASSLADRSAKARQIERIDAMIPEGTLIPGILETAINSDLPGQIRAITSQDVYSFDGRRVLIPTGTRLIGEYQSEITRGQERIFVIWTRLIRDDRR